jgi:hypothetical protein
MTIAMLLIPFAFFDPISKSHCKPGPKASMSTFTVPQGRAKANWLEHWRLSWTVSCLKWPAKTLMVIR